VAARRSGDRVAQPFLLRKHHIRLLTPSGREIGVAPQQTIIADSAGLTKLFQKASVQRHPVIMNFSQRSSGPVAILFQIFPVGDGTVATEVPVTDDHVSRGPILFANPQGSWDAGTYRLEINNEVAKAAIPITLE
jgi:hypothetical protein